MRKCAWKTAVLLNNGKNYVRVWVKADVVPMFHPVTEDCPHDAGHGLFLSQQIVPFPNLNAGEDFSHFTPKGRKKLFHEHKIDG